MGVLVWLCVCVCISAFACVRACVYVCVCVCVHSKAGILMVTCGDYQKENEKLKLIQKV